MIPRVGNIAATSCDAHRVGLRLHACEGFPVAPSPINSSWCPCKVRLRRTMSVTKQCGPPTRVLPHNAECACTRPSLRHTQNRSCATTDAFARRRDANIAVLTQECAPDGELGDARSALQLVVIRIAEITVRAATLTTSRSGCQLARGSFRSGKRREERPSARQLRKAMGCKTKLGRCYTLCRHVGGQPRGSPNFRRSHSWAPSRQGGHDAPRMPGELRCVTDPPETPRSSRSWASPDPSKREVRTGGLSGGGNSPSSQPAGLPSRIAPLRPRAAR